MRRTGLVLALSGVLAGCGQGTTAEQAAQEAGLMPAPVDVVLVAPATPAITNPYLRATRDALDEAATFEFPAPPEKPDYATMFAVPKTSGYRGWNVDRVDASSYDALTNSLNAILQRMAPEEAVNFDRVVKFVLMNTTKDPLIAKKAAGGGQISDQEILQMVQSYVHNRTPREIVDLARRMYESQQRLAGRGAPPAAPFGQGGAFQ